MVQTVSEEVLEKQNAQFKRIAQLIEQAQTIALCSHTNPDGDTLGSELALSLMIQQKWPGKNLALLLADDEEVPRIYQFLPGSQDLVCAKQYTYAPDVFIGLDMPTINRTHYGQAVAERAGAIAVIDHHPTDETFGCPQVTRASAAATGILVAQFAQACDITITPDIANCLFCALVTDTGRFQYQNADAEAFEMASMLVDAGASPSEISLHVYQSFRVEYLHLQSIVMGRIVTFSQGKIAYSYATQDDIERTGAKQDETDGLIDLVRSAEGSQVVLFLKETTDGKVRGNLRAKGDYDVSKVAREMGGGGHVAAAGFTADGDIDDVLTDVLPRLQALVREV